MDKRILTYLNECRVILLLFIFYGMAQGAHATINWNGKLTDELAVPMNETPKPNYQAQTPQAPHINHYSTADYAAQALRTNTRSVASYGSGHAQAGERSVSATPSVVNPQTGSPVVIRDISTWKRSRATTPTLADEDLSLADGMVMQKIGGGNGPITEDDTNQPAITPIGDATWFLLLLVAGYACIIRRKKMIVHTLNK